jgi:hypothetical protein
MSPARNSPLVGLAARLTAPTDRETYAALLSYFDSLPADDDMLKMAQLLGFVTLVGREIPGAVNALLEELRAQAATAGEHRQRIEDRLAKLPQEIADGVDPDEIADAMSERFRQQIAASGLQETAALLNQSLGHVHSLIAQVAVAFQPVPQQYKGIGETISSDLNKLVAASRAVQNHNSNLIARSQGDSWLKQVFLGFALALFGAVCGFLYEKKQTADWMADLDSQIQRIQPPVKAPKLPVTKKIR